MGTREGLGMSEHVTPDDLQRFRRGELPPDFSDAAVNDEDVAALNRPKRRVNG